jgi:hypothetical protein
MACSVAASLNAAFACRSNSAGRCKPARSTGRRGVVPVRAVSTAGSPGPALQSLVSGITQTSDGTERLKRLIQMADGLPPLPAADKSVANRIMGCTSEAGMRPHTTSVCSGWMTRRAPATSDE